RNVHGEEDFARRRLRHTALAAADVLFDYVLQRIARHVRGLDQPLLAAGHIGDHDRGATRHAFGVEGSKDVELHARSPRIAKGDYKLATRKAYSPFPTRLLLHLLHIDPDGAATGEPDLPGGLVGDTEFERLGLAALDHVERFGHHRALDAAARDATEEIALIV